GTKREILREGWPVPGAPGETVQPFTGYGPRFAQMNASREVVGFDSQHLLMIEPGRATRLIPAIRRPVRLTTRQTGTGRGPSFSPPALLGPASTSDGRACMLNDAGQIVVQADIEITPGVITKGIFRTQSPALCDAADFDGNGQVDFFDYLDFVNAFGAGD